MVDRGSTNARRAERSRQGDAKQRAGQRYWSQDVTSSSNALDLEPGVFTWASPAAIARSLKRSAETSTRRKGTPYQSAMSMLNFFINRAGRNLPERRRRVLERAKDALRKEFGRR
jgi:putative cell wall-binding protein